MTEPDALTGEMVAVPRRGRAPMAAYFVRPPASGRAPGVVVIHEIFGLNANIRDIARRFAAAGYAALAVDLIGPGNRTLCLIRLFAGMFARPFNNAGIRDLRAGLDWLRGRPEVDPARTGAIGFCMGGSFALALACVEDDLKAASIYYGVNPRPLSAVARACPIVGSYPEDDFTRRGAVKLAAALERFQVPHDIKIYPHARHSFFNDQSGNFSPEAAADSWRRTLAFFERHLRAPAGAPAGLE